jgi:hypothetical protein
MLVQSCADRAATQGPGKAIYLQRGQASLGIVLALQHMLVCCVGTEHAGASLNAPNEARKGTAGVQATTGGTIATPWSACTDRTTLHSFAGRLSSCAGHLLHTHMSATT